MHDGIMLGDLRYLKLLTSTVSEEFPEVVMIGYSNEDPRFSDDQVTGCGAIEPQRNITTFGHLP